MHDRRLVQNYEHILYIFRNEDKNDLWTFGTGLYGQTGLGKILHKLNYPLNASKISKKKFIKVAGADTHLLAIGSNYFAIRDYFY